MKLIFWTRLERGHVEESDERETNLAEALKASGRDYGIDVEIRIAQSAWEPDIVDCDLVAMAGVKSRHWFKAYAEAGIPWLYFDKGYLRGRAAINWLEYWRMSVNSHHPIAFLERARKPRARADKMEFRFAPWQAGRDHRHILVDGGSEKNFKFNGIVPETATIGDVDAHCQRLVQAIKESAPGRPVIYRPKPSSRGRQAIDGAEFSRARAGYDKKSPTNELEGAHCVVTYNGAISFDANKIGVPSVVLGSGPGRPISSTRLLELERPRLATDEERRQWLANLAWCQFKPAELEAGLLWPIVKEMLEVTPIATPAEACPCLPL